RLPVAPARAGSSLLGRGERRGSRGAGARGPPRSAAGSGAPPGLAARGRGRGADEAGAGVGPPERSVAGEGGGGSPRGRGGLHASSAVSVAAVGGLGGAGGSAAQRGHPLLRDHGVGAAAADPAGAHVDAQRLAGQAARHGSGPGRAPRAGRPGGRVLLQRDQHSRLELLPLRRRGAAGG
ncbi:hypothetical protein H632_c5514p0, partial [Helicosporidium sp. ATCC 50920]